MGKGSGGRVDVRDYYNARNNALCNNTEVRTGAVPCAHNYGRLPSPARQVSHVRTHVSTVIAACCLVLPHPKPHRTEANLSRNPLGVLKHGLHRNIPLVTPELQHAHPHNDGEHGPDADGSGREVAVRDGRHSGEGHVLLLPEAEACNRRWEEEKV